MFMVRRMSIEEEQIVKEIVSGIRWLTRAVYLESAKISKRFGLTVAQSTALRNLIVHGPISSADLSRKMYVTPANITGIVDRLEKKGLVKRSRQAVDRRIVLLSSTEKGEHLGKCLPDPIEIKLINGLADLGSEEIRRLGQSLDQLLTLIDPDKVEKTLVNLDEEP